MGRAVQYSFDEAMRSLWRGRQSGLLSTTTIALALFVLGAFLVVTANLDRLGAEWSAAAEMSVYLTDDATPADRMAVEALVAPEAPESVVAAREYVSKADALVRFKQTFRELAQTADSIGGNPIPASYEVRLKTPAAAASVEQLVDKLRTIPGVADVRYDRQWLERLQSAIGIVRTVGFGLGLLLTVAAALTVANVVRLALYARRDEIEIMQLVGAPQAYIRGPFVMEGVLQGGIGALLALAALAAVFFALRARYLVPFASAINLSTVQFLSVELCLLLVAGGMLVGCLGGFVAARES
ncbi:MAG TPA: ABC transporter permease [Vicinamibacterales bacterium]|nr:ABC transporter permease [Vicinamibacterales bacterium]